MRSALGMLMVVLGLASVSYGQAATGLPRVVATFKRTNQAGPISMQTIFTPPDTGIYRITVVIVVTAGNGQQGSDWEPTFEWEDENGDENYLIPIPTQSTTEGSSSLSIHDLRGKPIKGGVVSSGDTSGSKYDVFVVVEQIM